MPVRWNSADLPAQKSNTRPAASRATTGPAAAGASPERAVMQESPGLSVPAAQHYVGPYQMQVANGTHYPGRVRVVIVGPAAEDLPAALVAAITQFIEKP